ncbi:MAG: saccharopine dehydrogenase C-terminal domain-containing protein [Bacteroidota bacterium]
MNRILIIGAGRSATALIHYVLENAPAYNWNVIVADSNLKLAQQKTVGYENCRATWLDVTKVNDRRDLIGRADVVISLLPAHLHLGVGHDCIKLNKHLITASYVSKEMYRLGDEARDKELLFMGEMGLDPGIDHMSAMRHINQLKEKGAKITAFRSYTGGLIDPEHLRNNPWKYKFTWNPRNIVLAGQGTAQYLNEGKFHYIPYNRLFKEYKVVEVDHIGELEVYANRDSLLYQDTYGLEGVPSIYRGTLRYPGFCDAWNALVKIGLTDANFPILHTDRLTYHSLMDAYTAGKTGNSVKERTASLLGEAINSSVMEKLDWLGLFRKKRIRFPNATPALILEQLLLEKWKLEEEDKDMIVMQHEFEYELGGKKKLLKSNLTLKGEDSKNTAMSKLVGLPLGVFTKLLMQGKIKSKGVHIPVMQEVYEPVLEELKDYGVVFENKEVIINKK